MLIQRGVISTFSVDVMGEQGLTIIDTAHSRIGIRSAICMEGWLSEIRGEGGVRKPSCCVKENWAAFFQIFSLLYSFLLSCSDLLFSAFRCCCGALAAIHTLLVLENLNWLLFSLWCCLLKGLSTTYPVNYFTVSWMSVQHLLVVLSHDNSFRCMDECSVFVSVLSPPPVSLVFTDVLFLRFLAFFLLPVTRLSAVFVLVLCYVRVARLLSSVNCSASIFIFWWFFWNRFNGVEVGVISLIGVFGIRPGQSFPDCVVSQGAFLSAVKFCTLGFCMSVAQMTEVSQMLWKNYF